LLGRRARTTALTLSWRCGDRRVRRHEPQVRVAFHHGVQGQTLAQQRLHYDAWQVSAAARSSTHRRRRTSTRGGARRFRRWRAQPDRPVQPPAPHSSPTRPQTTLLLQRSLQSHPPCSLRAQPEDCLQRHLHLHLHLHLRHHQYDLHLRHHQHDLHPRRLLPLHHPSAATLPTT